MALFIIMFEIIHYSWNIDNILSYAFFFQKLHVFYDSLYLPNGGLLLSR